MGNGMSELQAAGTIILFFVLRCIVPLAITVAIGYLMNRLVDRWEAEETAAQEGTAGIEPVMPAAKKAASTTRSLPCWIVRNCDEEKRASCPAYLEPSLPCWIARLLSEGKQPDNCPDCPIYDPKLAIN
jgi:hypothetical protein